MSTISRATGFNRRPATHIFSRLNSLKECATFEDAIKKAGMDFTAIKKPMFIPVGLPNIGDAIKYYQNPDHVAIEHENGTYLGTTGSNYGLVQYPDIFEFSQAMTEEVGVGYEYGGVSGGGRNAYLVMKTAEFIEISAQDRIECYFYFVSSHNRSTGLNLIPSPLRTSNNTVMLFPGVSAIRFRHTKNVMDRLARAKKSIGKVREYFKKFEDSFKELAQTELTPELETVYLKTVFPGSDDDSTRAENMRLKVKDIHMTEPSLQFPSTKRTLLGLYFATVQYADHYMTVRKTGEKDEMTARLESTIGIDGAAARRKAEALAIAMQFRGK